MKKKIGRWVRNNYAIIAWAALNIGIWNLFDLNARQIFWVALISNSLIWIAGWIKHDL